MHDAEQYALTTRISTSEPGLYIKCYGTSDSASTQPTIRAAAFVKLTSLADKAIRFTRQAFTEAHKMGIDPNIIKFKCGGQADPLEDGLYTTEFKAAFIKFAASKQARCLTESDFADLLEYGRYLNDYGIAKVIEWRTPTHVRPYASGVKVKVRSERGISDPTFDGAMRRLYAVGDPDEPEYAACMWIRDDSDLRVHGVYTGHGSEPASGEGGASSGVAMVQKKIAGERRFVQEGRPTPTSTGFHAGVKHLCEPGKCPRLDYHYCVRCMHRVLRADLRKGMCLPCVIDREWVDNCLRVELPARQAEWRAFEANEEARDLVLASVYDADPILADAAEHAVNAAIAAESEWMWLVKQAREITSEAAHKHNVDLGLDDHIEGRGFRTGEGFHFTELAGAR